MVKAGLYSESWGTKTQLKPKTLPGEKLVSRMTVAWSQHWTGQPRRGISDYTACTGLERWGLIDTLLLKHI